MKSLSTLLLLHLALYATSYAQWNAQNGIAVSLRPGDQQVEELITDKLGGVWVIYSEGKLVGDNNPKLFAQHLDANGYVTVAKDISINSLDDQQYLHGAYASSNGDLLVYYQSRYESLTSYRDIYLQKIALSGVKEWGERGKKVWNVPVEEGLFEIHFPFGDLLEAGNNECYLAFTGSSEESQNTDHHLYIQKMNAAGERLWGDSAISIANELGISIEIFLYPDGKGGAFLAYQQWLYDPMLVQHFDSNGTISFPTPGIAVKTHPVVSSMEFTEWDHAIAAYDGGFAVYAAILNQDTQTKKPYYDITINTFNAAGEHTNGPNGIIADDPQHKVIAVDRLLAGANGSVVYIYRHALKGNGPLYIKKTAIDGHTVWEEKMVGWDDSSIISLVNLIDGPGGYFTAWDRGDSSSVLVQLVDTDGNPAWTGGGIGMGAEGKAGIFEPKIVRDDLSENCIVCWRDAREPANGFDIYCAKIERNGHMPDLTGHVSVVGSSELIHLYPNPARGQLHVRTSVPDEHAFIEIYDMVGRKVKSVSGIPETVDIETFLPGTYVLRLRTSTDTIAIPFIIQ